MWCPAGYECVSGAQTACSSGEYSLGGNMTCEACTVGYMCPIPGVPPIK